MADTNSIFDSIRNLLASSAKQFGDWRNPNAGMGRVATSQMQSGIGNIDSGSLVRGVDNSWYTPNWPASPPAVQMQNAPTPMPSMAPQAPQDPNYRFAFETMPRDDYWAQNGPRPNFQPQQPPMNIGNIIREIFPNEATKAATIASTENAQYDSRRADNVNQGGSRDRGIFQINEDTFNGLMKRRGKELKAIGVHSYEDMYDPRKNAQVAKLILGEGGPGRWFGWQNTGYDLNNNMYSKEDRADYEVKQLKNKKR